MEVNEFWSLIQRVKILGGSDIDDRTDALSTELKKLEPSEIIAFNKIFSRLLDQAYTNDLWGAAYTIQGGCGDDGFWDFRSSLVSLGKEIFEGAIAKPDTLADLDEDEIDNLYYEGFQYVANDAYKSMTGTDLPRDDGSQLDNPSGEDWDYDNDVITKAKLPRLYIKYWD